MIIHKKSIILTICVALICVNILIACIGCKQKEVVASAEQCVVIDAGHGGIDGGVMSKDGLKESEINLELAKKLKTTLERRKIKVVMTRNDDKALAVGKKNDMAARKKIIVSSNCFCVVSIHTNKFSNKNRSGTQVFFDDTRVGENFAVTMQNYINEQINKKYRERSAYEAIKGDFYIAKCKKVPSIIIECGFISNEHDVALLKNDKFKADLVDAIADVVQTQAHKAT